MRKQILLITLQFAEIKAADALIKEYFLCPIKPAILAFEKENTHSAILENRSNYLPN
jgi:hypothetical protein